MLSKSQKPQFREYQLQCKIVFKKKYIIYIKYKITVVYKQIITKVTSIHIQIFMFIHVCREY